MPAPDLAGHSADHPHGPPDPRWIDDEGRCVLCGRDYWESQARALAAEVEPLRRIEQAAHLVLDKGLRELDGLRAALSDSRQSTGEAALWPGRAA